MYTETSYPNSSDFQCDPIWPAWSQTETDPGRFTISTETALIGEGAESMRCNLVTTSGGWWGMGIASGAASLYEDLTRFAGGSLKCKMMAPAGFAQNVRIGVQSGTIHPLVRDFLVNPFDHGLVADGNWHDISIPLSTLGIPTTGTYSLQRVHLTWMVCFAGTPTANAFIYFDDVRWEAAP